MTVTKSREREFKMFFKKKKKGEESSRCLSNKEEAIERLAAIEFGAGRENGGPLL